VQSRNVLLTRSVWRGGNRNTSHDAAGPRPAGRTEESQERPDHAAAGGRGDRAERTACSEAIAEAEDRRRPGSAAPAAGKIFEPRLVAVKVKQSAQVVLGQAVYRAFGPTLAGEYLSKHHSINVSRETVRGWMIEAKLWRAKKQSTEKIHLWQRWSRVGKLVQWGTSKHVWLEDRGPKLYLINMIDDASSRLHARFVLHDSTAENMRLLWTYVERHGRPGGFCTDKASLFQTAPKVARDIQELPRDERAPLPPTQIGRALRDLDIVWIGAHSPPSQRTHGTQLPDSPGPAGEGIASDRSENTGRGQCLSGNGVHPVMKPDARCGSGQCRRCAPAVRQRALAGRCMELCRDQTSRQRLHDPARQQDLPDCAQRHSRGSARGRCAGRASARGVDGGALPKVLSGDQRMSAAAQSAKPQGTRSAAWKPAASRAKRQWMKDFHQYYKRAAGIL